jgi:anhydro-N-acetylmuramic acid kinase
MSGSSLDGLDVCLATFRENETGWHFEIHRAETIELPENLMERLKNADRIDQIALQVLDVDYGCWIGNQVVKFIESTHEKVDFVSVHGHTVFHEPKMGISLQIGNGDRIAERCGLPVIDNFRIDDIKKGGQGAPLVPLGEYFLFPDVTAFVNLGGISNVSIMNGKSVRAWDICPCNQVLNFFASQMGLPFDRDGELAKSGKFDVTWYESLRVLDFFGQQPPKSLSNQWSRINITDQKWPSAADALHTYTHLIAELIVADLIQNVADGAGVMFTGGGTHNGYLIDLIKNRAKSKFEVIVPEKSIVNFKEALIFGFLGTLRMIERVNIFSSVTGANEDSIAGQIHNAQSLNLTD